MFFKIFLLFFQIFFLFLLKKFFIIKRMSDQSLGPEISSKRFSDKQEKSIANSYDSMMPRQDDQNLQSNLITRI